MESELDILFQEERRICVPASHGYQASDAESFLRGAVDAGVSQEALLLGAHFHRTLAGRGDRRRKMEAVCLVIAAKFLDGWVKDDVEDFLEKVKVAPAELPSAEWEACQRLEWQFHLPNPIAFLRCFSHDADGWNRETRALAKGLLLALVLDPAACLLYKPSTQAAAALYAAKMLTAMGSWTKQHENVCRAREKDVCPCAQAMLSAGRRALVVCPKLIPDQLRAVLSR
jgi:hypothetical protein